MKTERMIVKIDADGNSRLAADTIAAEVLLHIYVNHDLLAELECTPLDMRELVLGYLYTNGKVDSPEQIEESFVIVQKEVGVYEARLNIRLNQAMCESTKSRNAVTWCGTAPQSIMSCMDTLLHTSEAFQETGCIHAAGLFELHHTAETEDALEQREAAGMSTSAITLRYLGEDISRYYALYKAVGKALAAGADFSRLYLCTTGRLPVGYMKRVIRAGISCVISRSAPTDAALWLAERHGILTCGFASAKRMNLYPTLTGYAILAGGKASRLNGIDKSQLEVKGRTMLEHILEQLPEDRMPYLSYNREPAEFLHLRRSVRLIKDQIEGIGPIGGLYTVLQTAAKDGFVRLLFVACDLPWYNKRITEVLLQDANEAADAVVIRTGDGRVHPLCGIYRISCLPILKQLLEEKCYKLQVLLDRVRTVYLEAEQFGLQDDWFKNINTPEDYNEVK